MSPRSRAKHLTIEILIGILCVVAIVAYAHTRRGDANLRWPWISFVGFTAIVFGYPISWFRTAWRIWLFWVTLSILLLVHIIAFVFVFTRLHNWTLGYYGLLAPIDAGALVALVGKLFPKPPSQIPVRES